MSVRDAALKRNALTSEHFENPQPGDRFHEHYSAWVHVLVRLEGLVVWHLATGDEVRVTSVSAFAKHFAYGSIPGYSMTYRDNKPVEELLSYLPDEYRAASVSTTNSERKNG